MEAWLGPSSTPPHPLSNKGSAERGWVSSPSSKSNQKANPAGQPAGDRAPDSFCGRGCGIWAWGIPSMSPGAGVSAREYGSNYPDSPIMVRKVDTPQGF
ncbi:hypothetical protein EAI_04809 [Harpegnathos saltator]|uniref:Uncharacterized protein n=1 Tax=Harpegnathos saltator TaxID=610380 RepID=E2BIX0_HARSA|nr:hypothetical protein EAI_04809 [Harpegnathos saltator]